MELSTTDDEFCTLMRLPDRIHKPGTEPDVIQNLIHYSNLQFVHDVKKLLTAMEFAVLENSYLRPVIKLASMENQFSAKLFHFFMQRRILTRGQDLWFSFAHQPLRFSLREFYLTTGLLCVVEEDTEEQLDKKLENPYSWMKGDRFNVKDLVEKLQNNGGRMTGTEKVSLGAAIITEGVIVARNPTKKIKLDRLLKYMDYDVFSKMPWGKIGYEALCDSIRRMNAQTWAKERYEMQGFVWAIIFWAFSAVPELGRTFATPCESCSSSDPLCLQWKSAKFGGMGKVITVEKRENVLVKTIIGDPKQYNNLVPPTHQDDRDFESVVSLVQQGYRMTRDDWIRGELDILVASGEIGNKHRRARCAEPMSDSQKLDLVIKMVMELNNKVEELNNKVEVIQKILGGKENNDAEDAGNDVVKENKDGAEEEAKRADGEEEAKRADGEDAGNGDGSSKNENDTTDDDSSQNTQRSHRDDDAYYAGDDEHTENTIEDTQNTEVLTVTEVIGDDDEVLTEILDIDEESGKTRVASPTPHFSTPNFNLLSEDSCQNPNINEVEMVVSKTNNEKIVCEDEIKSQSSRPGVSDVQCLKKKKKRVEEGSKEGIETNAPIANKKKKKNKPIDEDDFVPRRSGRELIPSIHTQPPFTAERKKHPIFYPFAKVENSRLERFTQWKKARKAKLGLVTGITADKTWFKHLEIPGMKITSKHIEAGVQLLRLRKESNPDMFLNRKAIILGQKFLKEIDDSYFDFVNNKDAYEVETHIDGYDLVNGIGVLYAPRKVNGELWVGLVFDLEKRKISVLNCAVSTYSKEVIEPYVVAYASVIPYLIRKISKDCTIDVTPFKIEVDSKDLPQVASLEDSGIYTLKFIECHAMRIRDLRKLSEKSIGEIRLKLAVDIFSELSGG